MNTLEALEQQATDNSIYLLTYPLPLKGLYYACAECGLYTITLNSSLETTCERCSVLAEELGHYYTTPIDLFSAAHDLQEAYERRAVAWAANALLPPAKLISAWRAGVREPWELAEYCDVTESFLKRAMELYAARYGRGMEYGGCLITFDLLHITEAT